MRIFLDMDGVIADFIGGLGDIFPARRSGLPPSDWNVHEVLGLSELEMWEAVLERGDGFWANLSPYSWMWRLVDRVSSLSDEWYIATTPQNTGACVAGKLQWLMSNFGEDFGDYFLGRHKFVLANPKSVLIDDSDYNVEYFREAGGRAILFPQPWNSNRELVDTRFVDGARVQYVTGCLESMAEEIAAEA
jgi:5'(3')-deoxyribonucleotidase